MDIFTKWLNKKSLMESGFARVRRIMFGDVPDIRTIGIVTAQNPDGQRPWPGNDIESERDNRDQNKSLEQYLRTRNFGPIKVKGKFGVQEDSFLIPNISKEELVQIGRWFSQQSVIWGQKAVDRSNNPYMRFEYIDTESGRTQSLRTVRDRSTALPSMCPRLPPRPGQPTNLPTRFARPRRFTSHSSITHRQS